MAVLLFLIIVLSAALLIFSRESEEREQKVNPLMEPEKTDDLGEIYELGRDLQLVWKLLRLRIGTGPALTYVRSVRKRGRRRRKNF